MLSHLALSDLKLGLDDIFDGSDNDDHDDASDIVINPGGGRDMISEEGEANLTSANLTFDVSFEDTSPSNRNVIPSTTISILLDTLARYAAGVYTTQIGGSQQRSGCQQSSITELKNKLVNKTLVVNRDTIRELNDKLVNGDTSVDTRLLSQHIEYLSNVYARRAYNVVAHVRESDGTVPSGSRSIYSVQNQCLGSANSRMGPIVVQCELVEKKIAQPVTTACQEARKKRRRKHTKNTESTSDVSFGARPISTQLSSKPSVTSVSKVNVYAVRKGVLGNKEGRESLVCDSRAEPQHKLVSEMPDNNYVPDSNTFLKDSSVNHGATNRILPSNSIPPAFPVHDNEFDNELQLLNERLRVDTSDRSTSAQSTTVDLNEMLSQQVLSPPQMSLPTALHGNLQMPAPLQIVMSPSRISPSHVSPSRISASHVSSSHVTPSHNHTLRDSSVNCSSLQSSPLKMHSFPLQTQPSPLQTPMPLRIPTPITADARHFESNANDRLKRFSVDWDNGLHCDSDQYHYSTNGVLYRTNGAEYSTNMESRMMASMVRSPKIDPCSNYQSSYEDFGANFLDFGMNVFETYPDHFVSTPTHF